MKFYQPSCATDAYFHPGRGKVALFYRFSLLHGRTLHSTLYNTTEPTKWLTYEPLTYSTRLACQSLIPATFLVGELTGKRGTF